jgi:hypothetical protein
LCLARPRRSPSFGRSSGTSPFEGRRWFPLLMQAVIRSLGVSAVKGSHRAQLALANLVAAIEKKELDERRDLFGTMIEYKRGWLENFEECDRRGIPRPEPVPHPHDIEINARTGEVYFNGPFDDVEKAEWDNARQRIKDGEEEIGYLTKLKCRTPEERERRDRAIETEQRLTRLLAITYPDEETRRVPGFNIRDWRKRQKALMDIRYPQGKSGTH